MRDCAELLFRSTHRAIKIVRLVLAQRKTETKQLIISGKVSSLSQSGAAVNIRNEDGSRINISNDAAETKVLFISKQTVVMEMKFLNVKHFVHRSAALGDSLFQFSLYHSRIIDLVVDGCGDSILLRVT